MVYCGDYSMIILNGKLLYRDHKSLKSTQINLGGKTSYNLHTISVSDDNLLFLDEHYKVIYSKFTDKPNNNSSLKCNLQNRSIFWDDVNGNVLWRYLENNSYSNPTTTSLIQKPSASLITTRVTSYIAEPVTKTIYSVTSTKKMIYSTYTNVSYQGKIGSKYYLGVNELKEFVIIEAMYGGTKNKPMKYTKWLISSENKPSYMYLANNNGSLSNYCLNVGQSRDSKSYYLSISKCSQTSYLFKYNVSFTDYEKKKINGITNIAVYKNSSALLTNAKGIPYCIYYTDTLRIEECKDPKGYENFDWLKYKNSYHTKTSSKYETTTYTKYSVTSTLKPVVIIIVIISYLYPIFTPTKTNNITPTESKNTLSISLRFKGINDGDSSIYLSVPKLETNKSFNMASCNNIIHGLLPLKQNLLIFICLTVFQVMSENQQIIV